MCKRVRVKHSNNAELCHSDGGKVSETTLKGQRVSYISKGFTNEQIIFWSANSGLKETSCWCLTCSNNSNIKYITNNVIPQVDPCEQHKSCEQNGGQTIRSPHFNNLIVSYSDYFLSRISLIPGSTESIIHTSEGWYSSLHDQQPKQLVYVISSSAALSTRLTGQSMWSLATV